MKHAQQTISIALQLDLDAIHPQLLRAEQLIAAVQPDQLPPPLLHLRLSKNLELLHSDLSSLNLPAEIDNSKMGIHRRKMNCEWKLMRTEVEAKEREKERE